VGKRNVWHVSFGNQGRGDVERISIYNPDSEATCRIGIDLILLQCSLLLQRKLSSDSSDKPLTPSKKRSRKTQISLFPEAEISVDVKSAGEVSGRADWAFGYGTKFVEAKTRSEYSKRGVPATMLSSHTTRAAHTSP
jgi:hypothetical protein